MIYEIDIPLLQSEVRQREDERLEAELREQILRVAIRNAEQQPELPVYNT